MAKVVALRLDYDTKRAVGESTRFKTAIEKQNLATLRSEILLGKSSKKLQAYGASARVASRDFGVLNSALVSFGAYLGGRALLGGLNTLDGLSNRLRILAGTESGVRQLKDSLFELADEVYGEFGAMGELFTRIQLNAKNLNLTNREALDITKAVQQAAVIGGASAQEAAGAIRQLTQALGSGTVRGDEFRALAEQMPFLMQEVAREFGKTRGEINLTIGGLRELAYSGQLSSQDFVRAVQSAMGNINSTFQNITPTIAQAWQKVTTNMLEYVNGVNDASDASKTISGVLVTLSDHIDDVADSLLVIGGSLLAARVGTSLAAITTALRTTNVAAVTLANSLGIIVAALGSGYFAGQKLMEGALNRDDIGTRLTKRNAEIRGQLQEGGTVDYVNGRPSFTPFDEATIQALNFELERNGDLLDQLNKGVLGKTSGGTAGGLGGGTGLGSKPYTGMSDLEFLEFRNKFSGGGLQADDYSNKIQQILAGRANGGMGPPDPFAFGGGHSGDPFGGMGMGDPLEMGREALELDYEKIEAQERLNEALGIGNERYSEMYEIMAKGLGTGKKVEQLSYAQSLGLQSAVGAANMFSEALIRGKKINSEFVAEMIRGMARQMAAALLQFGIAKAAAAVALAMSGGNPAVASAVFTAFMGGGFGGFSAPGVSSGGQIGGHSTYGGQFVMHTGGMPSTDMLARIQKSEAVVPKEAFNRLAKAATGGGMGGGVKVEVTNNRGDIVGVDVEERTNDIGEQVIGLIIDDIQKQGVLYNSIQTVRRA